MAAPDAVRTSALSNMNSPAVGLGNSAIGSPIMVLHKDIEALTAADQYPYRISQGSTTANNEHVVITDLPNLGLYLELYALYRDTGAIIITSHPTIQVFGLCPQSERSVDPIAGRLLPWDVGSFTNPNGVAADTRYVSGQPGLDDFWIPLNTPDAAAIGLDLDADQSTGAAGKAFTHTDSVTGDVFTMSDKVFVALVGVTRVMVVVTVVGVSDALTRFIVGRVVG